jgi:hypothetical protein
MSLSEEINKMRQEIRTDGYPMSINEWISLYQGEEIDIHPEFQRFYRWSHEQKTRLIESIMLGIPIPPIFVSQRKDGVWDVVDGLQRLSTIYEFLGILKDENGKKLPPLILEGTEYLPSLKGKRWDDRDEDVSLTSEERLLIKRSKLAASIILRESDEVAKYELFQRLNTGGSNLTDQEVRNCILVMQNRKFYEWIRSLSQYGPFQDAINLSERPLQEQYDVELVLRFIIFSRIELEELNRIGDVGLFITKKMVEMAKDAHFRSRLYEESFKSVFDLLLKSTASDSFRRYAPNKNKFTSGFTLSIYEVMACGLGYNSKNLPKADVIGSTCRKIWDNAVFKQWSGSGITASRRLPRLIPLGRKYFKK